MASAAGIRIQSVILENIPALSNRALLAQLDAIRISGIRIILIALDIEAIVPVYTV